MSAALHQICIIFFGILAGFLFRKAKFLSADSTSVLSGIVVNLVLPFFLFSSILNSGVTVRSSSVFLAVGLSSLMFLLSGLSGAGFVRLFRVPESDRGVYLFEILCGNTAYMGIPVCIAVLGKSSAFYASLLNIPYELICFSFGIFLLSGKFSFKRILNPPFLAALCGMILYLLRVPVPDVLVDGCAFIGQATSSCAMLIIGSALAEVPLRELFDDWRIIPYLFLRLAGLGVLMLVLLKPFHIDPVLHGVLVLMASMPAATNSTMLCHIYGGNRSLSAKLIFLSTAFSAVTIPIWSAICFQ